MTPCGFRSGGMACQLDAEHKGRHYVALGPPEPYPSPEPATRCRARLGRSERCERATGHVGRHWVGEVAWGADLPPTWRTTREPVG